MFIPGPYSSPTHTLACSLFLFPQYFILLNERFPVVRCNRRRCQYTSMNKEFKGGGVTGIFWISTNRQRLLFSPVFLRCPCSSPTRTIWRVLHLAFLSVQLSSCLLSPVTDLPKHFAARDSLYVQMNPKHPDVFDEYFPIQILASLFNCVQ